MKILYFSRQNPFIQSSAQSNRTRGLLEGLIRKGVRVDLYILNPLRSKKEKAKLDYLNYEFGNNLNIIQASNYIIYPPIISRICTLLFNPIYEYLFSKIMYKALSEYKGIVFTDLDYFLMKELVKIKMLYPIIKLICEVSEYPDYYQSQNISKSAKNKHLKTEKYFSNIFLRNLSGCILMTKSLYDYVNAKKIPNLNLLYLPMTVDLERFNNFKASKLDLVKPYILYVGVMNNAKDGIDILIESFFQISSLLPEFRMYLLGPKQPDTFGHLEKISKLGLSNRVRYFNEIDRDEIPSMLKNASLLVLPRPDSRQARGGFPTKLGEYLASSRPVCATKVGEIPNFLIDKYSAFLAKPGCSASFAEAMIEALSNPKYADYVGRNGRRVAEKHFNLVNQTEKLYNFICEELN